MTEAAVSGCLAGDVIRRTLLCTMDAGCERPELRTFRTDVVNEATERRGERPLRGSVRCAPRGSDGGSIAGSR